MANCLVTTLAETVSGKFYAPDELVIKVNHIDTSVVPMSARWIVFSYVSSANVRIEDDAYSFIDQNQNNIGSSVNLVPAQWSRLYLPNPPEGETYNIIVSNKYALISIDMDTTPNTKYDVISFDLSSLKHCKLLNALRVSCNDITGSLEDLKDCTELTGIIIKYTSVTGDIKTLANFPRLQIFSADYSNIYGDIAVFTNHPYLRTLYLHGCSEVYGDVEAFKNNQSINYIQFPQVAGHPCITGDILSFSGCGSLGGIYAANEAKLTGNISVFNTTPNIVTLIFNNTSVYGDIASLENNATLRMLNFNNSTAASYLSPSTDKVYGDIAVLSSMPNLESVGLQYSSVTGDVGDLDAMPKLYSILLSGTAVTGDINDFDVTKMPLLSTLNIAACPGIAGDITNWNFSDKLRIFIINSSGVIGDIGAAFENYSLLTQINISNTFVSGDVTLLYKNSPIFVTELIGCINLTGDLSQLPSELYYMAGGGVLGGTYSWSTTSARPVTSKIVCFNNINLGSSVCNMLINQSNCVPKVNVYSTLHKNMNVTGTDVKVNIDGSVSKIDPITGEVNTAVSNQCMQACKVLVQKGFGITINGSRVIVNLDD